MGRLVYDSDQGSMCPGCQLPVADCRCGKDTLYGARDGVVVARREVRRGKAVTVVDGLAGDDAAIRFAAQQLKRRIGVGGTSRKGMIEVQGDHRPAVVAWLEGQGHRVRLAGG
jgi:translation initiation factor 1